LCLTGIYRYTNKDFYRPFDGMSDSMTQWDLGAHMTCVNRAIQLDRLIPAQEMRADSTAYTYFPPYPPLGFLLFHILARLPWSLVQGAWLLGSILLLFVVARWQVRDMPPAAAAVGMAVVFLFKGTVLGLAGGQNALVATALAMAFVHFASRNRYHLAGLCLAAATIKITIWAPFLLYPLLSRQYRLFGIALLWSAGVNGVISLFYLGPIGHLRQMYECTSMVGQIWENTPAARGASGRVDLMPLLASAGLGQAWIAVVQPALLVAGATLLFCCARRYGNALVLLGINVLAALTMYHRDYDLTVVLLIAIPFLWQHRERFRAWHVLLLIPLIAPVTAIQRLGMVHLPSLALWWDLAGSSTALAVAFVGALIWYWENVPEQMQGSGVFDGVDA
jgi:hypothetical protein